MVKTGWCPSAPQCCLQGLQSLPWLWCGEVGLGGQVHPPGLVRVSPVSHHLHNLICSEGDILELLFPVLTSLLDWQ